MGGLIPEEIIDEISTRADIVEVVQKYVPLQRAGSRWKACCPFHQEKTPSFVVNPASNSCHCFGCGKGGSVFKFLMEMENLSFPEAARMLARWYNVMIPEPERFTFHKGEKVNTKENYNIRERLYLLHEKLAAWYMGNLKNSRNAKASAYFATRNMREESANRFMVGASLDEWDGMMKWAEQEKFTLDELKLAHLVSESSKTPGKYFDFFRNRLMFPIWDEQVRVVGFSARQIDPAQGGGKYVNSMESPIFKKSKLLYGLNFARKSIGEKKYAVICEGQMDVIAMHTAGVTNAIAPQGTAFGEEQAKIIKRCFFDGNMQITLATDADSAGIKAAIRDAEILLPMGASLKVATFPGGKDPDELLKNSGAQAVVDAVENAGDFFEFLYDRFTNGIPPSTPAEKASTAEKILKYIRLMDSTIAQDSYIQWLGDKVGLSPGTIRSEMSRQNILQQSGFRKYPERNYDDGTEEYTAQKEKNEKNLPDSEKDPRLHQAFAELLKVLLKSKKSTEKAAAELPAEVMDQGPLSIAVETVIEAQINGEWQLAPSLITKKMTLSSMESPELDEILAHAGEEEKIPAAVEEPSPETPQQPMSRQEAMRNARAEAKLRELGLPTSEQARNNMAAVNEKKRRREIDKKTVEDCIFVIRRHFLTKKNLLLKEKILKTPPGKARNELLIESVLLTRELMKLNNPEFEMNIPPPVLPPENPADNEDFSGEINANPQEETVPENAQETMQNISLQKEEESFEAYREVPPSDYQEEEPFVEEGMEEEIIELPDILQ
ncbi:MAG: DNA primase [Lentisphaeria bacterium]|nr:DNA primase [Lentisphaeria bacterium]